MTLRSVPAAYAFSPACLPVCKGPRRGQGATARTAHRRWSCMCSIRLVCLHILTSRIGTYVASVLTAAALSCSGCGKEIIPVPLSCPPCEQTPESACSYFELEDGTRIRSEYAPGDPNLPLIVGVHGFGGTYNDASLIFPKGLFPTLSFSLPGSLCSDHLPGGTPHTIAMCTVTLEKLLEHRADLLDEFGEGNVLIAGASFGAFVVADYFAKHPDSKMGAVIMTGQDTPLNNGLVDFLEWYLVLVHNISPFTDNTHLQEYLASSRVFDVSEEIQHTTNRWLIIGAADDESAPEAVAMAQRLGSRARYVELPGDHFMTLFSGDSIRELITENLDFLLPD